MINPHPSSLLSCLTILPSLFLDTARRSQLEEFGLGLVQAWVELEYEFWNLEVHSPVIRSGYLNLA